MRKFVFFLTVIAVVASMVPGQVFAQSRPQDFRGNLNVWSFSDEIKTIVDRHFGRTYRNVSVNYTQIPTEQFPDRLFTVLGSGAPDVVALEAAFVRQFVESGQLMDLTDIYEANRARLLAYPVEVGTYNGRVYALSWQACPGAFFYRRSLARQYLGTDDPTAVQMYFTNINKFLESARLIHERSAGRCAVVSNWDELFRPFLSSRANPWVVNGRLTIDPVIEQFMDIAKAISDSGLGTGHGQWSDGWFAGMRGQASRSWNNEPAEVFGYFLPTWGLHFVLKTNATNTSGDWAMIPGPVSYTWGGTWLAIPRNSSNPQLAREFINYIMSDPFQQQWARDTGDIVSSLTVQDRIKGNYRERFLGNQNHYQLFAEMSRTVNGRLIQGTDDRINAIFLDVVGGYIHQGRDKNTVLNEFRTRVRTELNIQ